MPGVPGARRKRLINGVVSTINGTTSAESFYTAVSSSSVSQGSMANRRRRGRSSSDSRKQRHGPNPPFVEKLPLGFQMADPTLTHQYRIDVARDGSMITAVPIQDEDLSNIRNQHQQSYHRVSPILFSDEHAFSNTLGSLRDSPNSDGQGSWSRQALLEMRGKQRHKLKSTKNERKFPPVNIPLINDSSSNQALKAVKGKIKEAKEVLMSPGVSPQQHILREDGVGKRPTRSQDSGPSHTDIDTITPRKPKVKWDLSAWEKSGNENTTSEKRDDDSFSSFPILSPNHKFDDIALDVEAAEKKTLISSIEKKSKNEKNAMDQRNNSMFPVLNPKPPDATASFETLLRQRIVEIESQQTVLADSIAQKQIIERTIVNAIDDNVEKNRGKMMALEEELKVIQWHLTLNSQNRQPVGRETMSKIVVSREVESVGDPSLTLLDSMTESASNAPTYQRDPTRYMESEMIVTGPDPPARPSPTSSPTRDRGGGVYPTYLKQKNVDRPRLPAPLRGKNKTDFRGIAPGGFSTEDEHSQILSAVPLKPQPIRPLPKIRQPPLHRKHIPQQRQQQQQQQQHTQSWNETQRYPILHSSTSNRTSLKKNVHFNFANDNESDELKFVPGDSSSDAMHSDSDNIIKPLFTFIKNQNATEHNTPYNQTDTTKIHYNQVSKTMHTNGNHYSRSSPPKRNMLTVTTIPDEESWQGTLYDVDAFDDVAGDFVPSEDDHAHQWRISDRHILKEEPYSNEKHLHSYPTQERTSSSWKTLNGVIVSSDSLKRDSNVTFANGFTRAVAAVVIQTAVRRFLAEIAAVERLYAVQVIQSAMCNWMARKSQVQAIFGPKIYPERNTCAAKKMFRPIRTKRVMFEDEYIQSFHNEAVKIQRCYRGWWARENLEVDHYAASTIQRVFRGWWAREILEVDRYCAVEIQRVIRGYLGRMSYIYDLYCIIVCQSVARRYLAFYTSAVRLANILYIQAMYRGYKVRSELIRFVKEGQDVAATMIQAQYRCYDAQMNFVNILADILIVQSVARRWSTLRKVSKLRKKSKHHQHLPHKKIHSTSIHTSTANQKVSQYLQHRSASHEVRNQNKESTARWQQRRVKPTVQPEFPIPKSIEYIDGFDSFHRDEKGADGWYDGNKSETSDMLRNWKGRSSKSHYR